MFHTYTDVTFTIRIGESLSTLTGTATYSLKQTRTGTYGFQDPPRVYETSTSVHLQGEAYRRIMRMIEALGQGNDWRRRERLRKELEHMDWLAKSRAMAVEERPPRRWTPGRNPGIPSPRFARIRCSSPRQSVPPRTRRRTRTWER